MTWQLAFLGLGKKRGRGEGLEEEGKSGSFSQHLGSTVPLLYAADRRPFLPTVMWGRGTGGKAKGGALGSWSGCLPRPLTAPCA